MRLSLEQKALHLGLPRHANELARTDLPAIHPFMGRFVILVDAA